VRVVTFSVEVPETCQSEWAEIDGSCRTGKNDLGESKSDCRRDLEGATTIGPSKE
jgi:hypothetical protein